MRIFILLFLIVILVQCGQGVDNERNVNTEHESFDAAFSLYLKNFATVNVIGGDTQFSDYWVVKGVFNVEHGVKLRLLASKDVPVKKILELIKENSIKIVSLTLPQIEHNELYVTLLENEINSFLEKNKKTLNDYGALQVLFQDIFTGLLGYSLIGVEDTARLAALPKLLDLAPAYKKANCEIEIYNNVEYVIEDLKRNNSSMYFLDVFTIYRVKFLGDNASVDLSVYNASCRYNNF